MYVYLAAESLVQKICVPGGININDKFIQCRTYIMASERVVLSNVLPGIPNESLILLVHYFGKHIPYLTTFHLHSTSRPQTQNPLGD
jgi:hypothetical protein